MGSAPPAFGRGIEAREEPDTNMSNSKDGDDRSEGARAVATNRRAYHDYFVEDTIEAGIALEGPEVKSVRARHAGIGEAYATIVAGEVWITECGSRPTRPPATTRSLPVTASCC